MCGAGFQLAKWEELYRSCCACAVIIVFALRRCIFTSLLNVMRDDIIPQKTQTVKIGANVKINPNQSGAKISMSRHWANGRAGFPAVRSEPFLSAMTGLYRSGVALIAKFCINIAFSGAVCILATLQYRRRQNGWVPIYGSVVAGASFNSRFICKLPPQPWPHTPLRHTLHVHQWRVESEWGGNKHTLLIPMHGGTFFLLF